MVMVMLCSWISLVATHDLLMNTNDLRQENFQSPEWAKNCPSHLLKRKLWCNQCFRSLRETLTKKLVWQTLVMILLSIWNPSQKWSNRTWSGLWRRSSRSISDSFTNFSLTEMVVLTILDLPIISTIALWQQWVIVDMSWTIKIYLWRVTCDLKVLKKVALLRLFHKVNTNNQHKNNKSEVNQLCKKASKTKRWCY